MRSETLFAVALAAFAVSGFVAPAGATIMLTYGAPGAQASTVPGVVTETFDTFTVGNHTSLQTAVGTMASPGAAICNANLWGGAGGIGRYLAVGAQSGTTEATFSFANPQAYVGVWLSALDPMNSIELISGGNVIGRLDHPALAPSLPSAYLSNPNTGEDPHEHFVYLNFFGLFGTTFDAVRFVNVDTGTGLEFDNLSISDRTPELFPGTPLPSGVLVIPEPSGAMLLLAPAAVLIARGRRSRTAPAR